jgi:alpha-1,6-mannosyltransferase
MTVRTWVGGIALASLVILGLAMAAAGPEVVPAAGLGDDPGWLRGAYGDGLGIAGGDYIQLERAALLAYAAVLICAPALPLRLLWAAICALLLAFAIAPPLLSLDVFSYLSYARLDALGGLNPYEAAPEDLPGDAALPFVLDNRDAVSAYGPLFSLLALPLAHLGLGTAVYALKALAGLSVVATAWLAARMAAARGLDPRPAAALIALNPLVLVHVVGGAHNDALTALVLSLGLAGALAAREAAGGVALVAAVGVKASAAFALPFAALEGLLGRRRLLLGLVVGAAGVVAVALAGFGSAVDGALDVAGENQERGSRGSFPNTIAADLGLGRDAVSDAAVALYAALVVGLLVWTARGADWVRAAAWAGLGLLIASSYVPPWYVILPLPLVAIARDRALVACTLLVSAYFLRYQVPGLGG